MNKRETKQYKSRNTKLCCHSQNAKKVGPGFAPNMVKIQVTKIRAIKQLNKLVSYAYQVSGQAMAYHSSG